MMLLNSKFNRAPYYTGIGHYQFAGSEAGKWVIIDTPSEYIIPNNKTVFLQVYCGFWVAANSSLHIAFTLYDESTQKEIALAEIRYEGSVTNPYSDEAIYYRRISQCFYKATTRNVKPYVYVDTATNVDVEVHALEIG